MFNKKKEKIIPSLKNINQVREFYLGETQTPEGFYFEDILNFNEIQFEMNHHFIQWLFPISTISKYNLSAPILSKEEAAVLSEEQCMKEKVLEAFKFVCKQYQLEILEGKKIIIVEELDFNGWWITPDSHNFLRITRILTCLINMNLYEYAEAFLECLEDIYNTSYFYISEKTFQYWKDAVYNNKM